MELKGFNFKDLIFDETGNVSISLDIICGLQDGSVMVETPVNYVYTLPSESARPIVEDINNAVKKRFEELQNG